MQFIVHGCYTLSEKNVVQQSIFDTNFTNWLKIFAHKYKSSKVL